MRNFLWIPWWFFGCFVLAGLVLRWWIGDYFFLSRYAGYLMPWLLLGLVPGVFWAGLMYHWRLAVLLGVSVAIIFATYAPLFLPRQAASIPTDKEIKVISFNTWSKNSHVGRIAEVVLGHCPDILLLQETEPEVFERLMKRLRDLYSGREVYFSYDPQLLQAVVSRYPVESSVSMKKKGQAQKVVLRSPVGRITVINVHPLRRGGWLRRYRKMASLLAEDIVHEAGPVILGGDFNITDQSYTYKLITKYLRNAHWEAGFGFGFTFPSSSIRLFGFVPAPPLARIDHIFFNDHFIALQAGTAKDSGGSDHFPVLAVFGLKE